VYDPSDPVPTRGGNNLMLELGPMDQRPMSSRKDVLKFETEPLKQAVEVAGPVRAELVVSTDAQDTDFMVKLVDVYPNRYEALVMGKATGQIIWQTDLPGPPSSPMTYLHQGKQYIVMAVGAGAQAELTGYALAGPASNNAQP
jgi:predicted acyl esterase